MNTDVALNYKAKLIQVEDKIEEIERIGFNIKPFREELEKLFLEQTKDLLALIGQDEKLRTVFNKQLNMVIYLSRWKLNFPKKHLIITLRRNC